MPLEKAVRARVASLSRLVPLCLFVLSVGANRLGAAAPPAPPAAYQADWASLTKHPDPKWFDDAKFGIYLHWSAYSVPAFRTEWYSRNMYLAGSPENKHHLATYGPLDKFGYKDFITSFTAARFDAEDWATLFEQAGARFAGPVAEHADGFSLWDSKLTRWNAARMGPKRDLVGELEKAIRRHKMKFVTTFHHQWLWGWYPTWDDATDCANPEFAGLYGPKVPPSAWKNNPKPDQAFCELWDNKVKEVIDKYRPDLIYFDSRMNIIDEAYRQDMLAYYYNQAAAWGREVAVTYKGNDLAKGAGILDLERGRMARRTDFKWMNDDAIDWQSWCFIADADYKSADRLVDELVDIVSKNGNLMLDIGPRPDGTIPDPIRKTLLGIGGWLKLNGEAIYGTRPWETYGEGPTKIKEGSFGEQKNVEFTPQDIRFTTRGDALYAILLAWPGAQVTIKSLPAAQKLWFGEIGQVHLLGAVGALQWTRNEQGLTVRMPAEKPCDYAYVLKITGK